MKKLLLLVAGLVVAGASFAQPHPEGLGPHHEPPHHKHKVWIPAHRDHGHYVRGHYVWR